MCTCGCVRPSPVMSARNTRYFMMLMNSATLFRHVEFLKEKTVEATLEVLKRYMTEAEQLIG